MVSGGAGAWLRATCTKYHVPGPRAMSVQLMGPCGVRKVEVDSCLALQAPSFFIPTPFMGLVELPLYMQTESLLVAGFASLLTPCHSQNDTRASYQRTEAAQGGVFVHQQPHPEPLGPRAQTSILSAPTAGSGPPNLVPPHALWPWQLPFVQLWEDRC